MRVCPHPEVFVVVGSGLFVIARSWLALYAHGWRCHDSCYFRCHLFCSPGRGLCWLGVAAEEAVALLTATLELASQGPGESKQATAAATVYDARIACDDHLSNCFVHAHLFEVRGSQRRLKLKQLKQLKQFKPHLNTVCTTAKTAAKAKPAGAQPTVNASAKAKPAKAKVAKAAKATKAAKIG